MPPTLLDVRTAHAAIDALAAAANAKFAADDALIADLQAQLAEAKPSSSIQWGSSVFPYPPETPQQAFQRVESAIAPDTLLRHFVSGIKAPTWPNSGAHPLVLSFKLMPSEVVAGTHDAELKAFFAATPSFYTPDNPARICYWHEPEDEIKKGLFAAADYRAAWVHIAGIARASGKPIRLTQILMGYTLTSQSGRNWRDYYPGDAYVDVQAWDTYVWGTPVNVSTMFDPARAVSVETGKPWAIAETGVGTVQFPDKATRQAKLTAVAKELVNPAKTHPEFVTYFDSDPDIANGGVPQYGWNITKDPAAVAAWKAGRNG